MFVNNPCLFFFDSYNTYFIITGILTLFTMFKEKNIFMVGLEKDQAGVVSVNYFQVFLRKFQAGSLYQSNAVSSICVFCFSLSKLKQSLWNKLIGTETLQTRLKGTFAPAPTL